MRWQLHMGTLVVALHSTAVTLNVDDPTDDVLVKLSFYVAEDRLGTEYELEGRRRLTPGPQLRVAAI